jgi:DNA-binding CsgD family transcriptional regulator
MTVRLIADKSGPGGDDPFNLVQLAGLHCLRGEWAEARRLAEAAVEGYTREGADLFPAWGLRGVAMVAAHQGRIDDARALASKGLELAIESGNLAVAVMHQQILGFVALSLGEFREADRWLSEAAATARRTGTLHPCRYKLEGDRIDAALAIGALESAEQMVNELEHAERAAATPWTLAIGARCRGQLEAARGDLEAADVALQRAVTEHEHLPMPFDLARTLLVKGQVHRRRKEKRLADTTLREALRLFESLGAPLWADKTRVELGRIGLRPRAPTELTDTERRVAELAAQGLSTREIAKVAFLAPKTVGNVLGRVYEKLGISSRAQLGALMTGGRLAGAGTEVEHR